MQKRKNDIRGNKLGTPKRKNRYHGPAPDYKLLSHGAMLTDEELFYFWENGVIPESAVPFNPLIESRYLPNDYIVPE